MATQCYRGNQQPGTTSPKIRRAKFRSAKSAKYRIASQSRWFFLPRTRHVESQPVPQGRAPAWNSLCHSWPGDIWRHCAHLKTVPGKVNVNIGLKTHTPGLRHIETITVYKLPSLYNVLQVVWYVTADTHTIFPIYHPAVEIPSSGWFDYGI